MLKFKTVCGQEFSTNENFGGLIDIQRLAKDENSSKEDCEKFKVSEMETRCKNCGAKKIQKNREFLKNVKANLGDTFDVVDTCCVAELIEHPFPDICPFTGSKFHSVTFDVDYERIIPLYQNKNDEIHTLPQLKVDFEEIQFVYNRVCHIDEEGYPEFIRGAQKINEFESKKIIQQHCSSILEKLDKKSPEYGFMYSLLCLEHE